MFSDVMRFTGEVEVKQREIRGELRSVLNNRVAISEGADSATYMDVTAWGSTAELIGQYLKKGDEFYAAGSLRNKPIKVGDKEIQTVYLNIERIKFTHGRKRKENEGKPEDKREE